MNYNWHSLYDHFRLNAISLEESVRALCQGSINSYGRPANARAADAHLQDRQEKATAAKAGVRRRRGPRMQVNL